jgi:hypothetical protein
VVVAGDAAHLFSPFGARGLNSGAADAENLAWKLALVVAGRAPASLLESYDAERRAAAVENLAVTDASMRFMVPHGPLRRLVRNAILRGSVRFPALRRRVNSGRLAQPFVYAASPIVVPGPDDARLPAHGDVAPDAPCQVIGPPPESPVERLRDLIGGGFVALLVCGKGSGIASPAAVRAARLSWPAPCRIAVVGPSAPLSPATVLEDVDGVLARRYGAAGGRAWLIRPDGHIAGSLPLPAADAVEALPGLQAVAIGAG